MVLTFPRIEKNKIKGNCFTTIKLVYKNEDYNEITINFKKDFDLFGNKFVEEEHVEEENNNFNNEKKDENNNEIKDDNNNKKKMKIIFSIIKKKKKKMMNRLLLKSLELFFNFLKMIFLMNILVIY